MGYIFDTNVLHELVRGVLELPLEQKIETLVERRWALWVPVVLHLSWEAADEWRSLVRWVDRVSRYAVPWETFYAALEASR